MNIKYKFKLPKVKVRLSKLQKWIMENCGNEEGLTSKEVYNRYYPDNNEIAENIKYYRKMKKWKERRKLQAKLKSRQSSISLAFNQLYLQKLVKRYVTKGIPSNWYWQDIDDQLNSYIEMCNKHINIDKMRFEEKKKRGEEIGIFEKCSYSNTLEHREKAQKCEIMLTKDWNKLINEHRPGRFILVGSELCMSTWPDYIKRINK